VVAIKVKLYARIEQGTVVELLRTDGNINAMFHRGLVWVDVSEVAGIAYGWIYDGHDFKAASCMDVPTKPIMSFPV
jgi:hypothetical protein